MKLYSLLTSFSIARLQQCLPFTVCAAECEAAEEQSDDEVCTFHIPERSEGKTKVIRKQSLPFTVLKHVCIRHGSPIGLTLQQHLSFTVCAEGCGTAEEQSDDEVRTSQVPERREGKAKVIKQQPLLFTVCAEGCETAEEQGDDEVRTSQVPERSEGKTKVISNSPTACGIETGCDNFDHPALIHYQGCNSTYRLRYARKGARQSSRRATIRSAHLKYLNKVKAKRR